VGSCLWVTGQEAFILFIYHESCKFSSETLEATLRTSWCHYPECNGLDVVVVHVFYMMGLWLLNWEKWDGKDMGVNENCIEHFGQKTCDTYRFVFDRYRSFIVYEACLFQEFLVHICPAAKITLLYKRVSKCQPPASKPTIHLLEIFLSTLQNSCLEIFNFPSVTVCQFLQHFSFSSVLVFQVLRCMQIIHIISVYQCPHKWQSHTFKSWNEEVIILYSIVSKLAEHNGMNLLFRKRIDPVILHV
jgi:hypothetical protein